MLKLDAQKSLPLQMKPLEKNNLEPLVNPEATSGDNTGAEPLNAPRHFEGTKNGRVVVIRSRLNGEIETHILYKGEGLSFDDNDYDFVDWGTGTSSNRGNI